MQFPSTILTIFSRAFGGSQSPDDSVIVVNPRISAVLEIPDGVRLFSASPGGTTTVNRSFIFNQDYDVNNGAAVSDTPLIIKAGLWDLVFRINFESNWTPLATCKVSMQSVDEFAGVAPAVWSTLGMTAVVQPTTVVPFRLNYDHDTNVRVNLPASGAGQRHVLWMTIFGNKLG